MIDDKLPKFTLSHDEKRDDWKLVNDATGRTKDRFESKSDATARGVLADAVGAKGGSVKIKTRDNRYQEERTYPRSRDPRSSKG